MGEIMEFILITGVVISFVTFLIIIGFAITWIVGKIIRRNGPKRTGKIGIIITLPIMLIGLITTGVSGYKIEEQQARADEIVKNKNYLFKKAAQQFSNKYLSVGSTLEDTGTAEYKSWGDAIDNSDDDFDVNETVANIVAKNISDIDRADTGVSYLKKRLTLMSKNDTGKYDYKGYEKAYNRIQKFYNFVSYPNGSYSDFSDTMTTLDDNVTDSYNWMNQ